MELRIKGMHCTSCESIISNAVKKVKGVKSFEINYATGKAVIDCSESALEKVKEIIVELGYNIGNDPWTIKISIESLKSFTFISGLIIVVISSYFLMQGFQFNTPTQGNLLLLFITGLMVGFHCIGMCGGFMLSQAKSKKKILSYGAGKLISYSVMGGLFGLIGSLFTFTPLLRGVVGIIAGLFLLVYGLNMLGLTWFRFRIPMPKSLNKLFSKNHNPFIIGLLNGLMIACGPLQAMYLYATGTGSVIQGSLALLSFGLGTLPVMIGFGLITSHISKQRTNQIVKASGALMLVLGLLMTNYGLTLTGTGLDAKTLITGMSVSSESTSIEMQDGYQVIRMTVDRYGWTPNKFVLKTGVPVKWVIKGEEITSCNNAIQVPKYNLEFDVKEGEQVIEFTPTEKGIVTWSCWMGMIPGVFIVKDDINNVSVDEVTMHQGSSCSSYECDQ